MVFIGFASKIFSSADSLSPLLSHGPGEGNRPPIFLLQYCKIILSIIEAFNRFLIYEVNLLGWRLALCRMAASLLFPMIIGVLTRMLWMRFQQ